ncbi:unnamed protein product, partial [marine sediment metagenome]
GKLSGEAYNVGSGRGHNVRRSWASYLRSSG